MKQVYPRVEKVSASSFSSRGLFFSSIWTVRSRKRKVLSRKRKLGLDLFLSGIHLFPALQNIYSLGVVVFKENLQNGGWSCILPHLGFCLNYFVQLWCRLSQNNFLEWKYSFSHINFIVVYLRPSKSIWWHSKVTELDRGNVKNK